MEIVSVESILPNHLKMPKLNALCPDENNYKVLLLQPQGDIEADLNGVRNHNNNFARQQYRSFLEDANENEADLVVTPEYSMPWSVLIDIIKEDKGPSSGKLWALGCESIKLNELEIVRRDLENQGLSSFATMIYEQLDFSSSKFVSPLAYVFKTPSIADNNKLTTVILVQFKTQPMGDPKHLEINGMQRGTKIYKFKKGNQISLMSLICADAFSFEEKIARENYDRALILHVQLNPEPRHQLVIECRGKILKYKGDETELLCLNWASNVIMHTRGKKTLWKNIAGSAWYLKSRDYDSEDDTLCSNHRRGLYYTWLQKHRTHALFFNYKSATYLLTASKVFHTGVPGSVSIRRGPQLTKTCTWDDEKNKWIEQDIMDDGFSTVIKESGAAQGEIKRIADVNPFEAERILALCSGEINAENWHEVKILDSCVIDLPEVIKRVTFAQDTDNQAIKFRTCRLQQYGCLWHILSNGEKLPVSIEDLKKGFKFKWSSDSPHQNVIPHHQNEAEESKLGATVIYIENYNIDQIKNTIQLLEYFIHKSSADNDESLSARQRFHIWYRTGINEVILYNPHRHFNIDKTDDKSPFDIGRVE